MKSVEKASFVFWRRWGSICVGGGVGQHTDGVVLSSFLVWDGGSRDQPESSPRVLKLTPLLGSGSLAVNPGSSSPAPCPLPPPAPCPLPALIPRSQNSRIPCVSHSHQMLVMTILTANSWSVSSLSFNRLALVSSRDFLSAYRTRKG